MSPTCLLLDAIAYTKDSHAEFNAVLKLFFFLLKKEKKIKKQPLKSDKTLKYWGSKKEKTYEIKHTQN